MKKLFLGILLFVPLQALAVGGTLSLNPESGTYELQKPFTVAVVANTDNVPINAAEGELHYDPSSLSVDSISIDGSILSTWATTPSYDSGSGIIHFSGWASKPYSGNAGLLLSITFRLLKNTQTNVDITSGAMLAADGEGNIITSLHSGIFGGAPQQIAASPLATNSPSAPVAFPSLAQFSVEKSSISLGQSIIARGEASPNTSIAIWLRKDAEDAKQSGVISAADGTFTWVSEPLSEAGEYRVWAAPLFSDGSTGSTTPQESIIVSSGQGAAAFSSGLDIALAFLPIFAALALLALGTAYFIHRARRS